MDFTKRDGLPTYTITKKIQRFQFDEKQFLIVDGTLRKN
jgi:hypothetical protein